VVGSSCVSPNGARLGKGEGFAEVEYGIMRLMGAVDENTPVVTTVGATGDGVGGVPGDGADAWMDGWMDGWVFATDSITGSVILKT